MSWYDLLLLLAVHHYHPLLEETLPETSGSRPGNSGAIQLLGGTRSRVASLIPASIFRFGPLEGTNPRWTRSNSAVAPCG